MKKILLVIAILGIGLTSCKKESLTPDQDREAFIKSTSFKVTDIDQRNVYSVESWDYFYYEKLTLSFSAPDSNFVKKYRVGANIKGKELLKSKLAK